MVFFTIFLIVPILVQQNNGCHLYDDKLYGGTFADCSRKNLSRIPTDLPRITTSLNLRKNNICVLHTSSNVVFRNLKYLDISHNCPSSLKSGNFKDFNNIQQLFLNNNYLTLNKISFTDDVFKPLQNLRKLHLHNNDQRLKGSYPEEAIGELTMIEELKIDTFEEAHFGFGFSKLFNLKRLLLGFQKCKLVRVQNSTFESFRNISLSLISLDKCAIVKVETGAFLPLLSLKHLSMSHTKTVKPREAVLSMYGFRGRTLSLIEMNNIFSVLGFRNERVEERILSNEFLLHLKDVCVEKFTMINNQLLWIGNTIFNSTFGRCIKYLDLSRNDFYGDIRFAFTLSYLENIVVFNLSTHARYKSESIMNWLGEDQHVPFVEFEVPETLEVFNLDGIALGHIPELRSNVRLYNAKSLKYVSFANNAISGMKHRIIGVDNITSLDISGNNCSDMNPEFFDDFPNLEALYLRDVQFGETYLLDYGRRLFYPLQHLKKIDLHNNNLGILDAKLLSSNLIEEIIISHNRFESVPFDLISTPHLHYLDLAFNSLTVLSDTELNLLDDLAFRNNLTLSLQGNHLSCACDNLDFIMWLFNTNVQVIRASTDICQVSDGSITNTSYVRDHYEEIWLACNGRMMLSVIIVIMSVFLLVIFIMYLTLRRKTLLVNIFLRMFGYGPLPPTQERTDYLNDAYIGYSDEDYKYICHTVRDLLENKHELELFIRDRDTIPGGQIADDIINGIDCSWKSLIYITTSFLNDQWCRFIINRVIYSSSKRPDGNVILVLSDDVRRGDIDPALLNVVEERNIFCEERYIGNDDRLWGDVALAINQNFMG